MRRQDVLTIDGKSCTRATGSPRRHHRRGDPRREIAPPTGYRRRPRRTLMKWADERARSRCAPTPTPPSDAMPPATSSAPKASACAAPSTCSSSTATASVRCGEMILAEETTPDRGSAPLARICCRSSARSSSRHLPAMDGLPVTIRLLDPPLHEFLPRRAEDCRAPRRRTGRVERRGGGAHRKTRGDQPDARQPRLPPGHHVPGDLRTQVRAIFEAAAHGAAQRASR